MSEILSKEASTKSKTVKIGYFLCKIVASIFLAELRKVVLSFGNRKY